jgi:hypothetical protein
MSLFKHPHLTRGIVRTPNGAFTVTRGLVEAPDHVGESLGWIPADEDDASASPRRDDANKNRDFAKSATR